MDKAAKSASKPPRKWRRLKIFILVMLIAGGGAWKAVEHYLAVDRYRPQLEAEIERATNLPASIERLDLDILPKPRLEALVVTLDAKDIQAVAGRVVAWLSLNDVLARRIRIRDVTVTDVVLTVSQDVTNVQSQLEELRDSLENAAQAALPGTGAEAPVQIERIRAGGTVVRTNDADEREVLGEFKLDVVDPLGQSPRARASASLPGYGPEARVEVDLGLSEKNPLCGEGTVNFEGIDLRSVLTAEQTPAATMSAHMTFASVTSDSFHAECTGTLSAPGQPLWAGTYAGALHLEDGVLTVDDFQWTSPGAEVKGNATRDSEGSLRCEVAQALCRVPALRWLMDTWPIPGLTPRYAKAAHLSATGLHFSLTPAAEQGTPEQLRVATGDVLFGGLGFALKNGLALPPVLQGRIGIKENTFEVQALTGAGVSLAGNVAADWGASAADVQLAGTVTLARDLLAPLLPGDAVPTLSADVTIESLAGRVAPDPNDRRDFVVRGRVDNGQVGIQTPHYADDYASVSGTFDATAGSVNVALMAASESLGPVRVEGEFDASKLAYDGTVSADLQRAWLSLAQDEALREQWAAVAALFGASTFDVAIGPFGRDVQHVPLTLQRHGAPALSGSVTLNRQEDGTLALGRTTVTGELPVEACASMLPPDIAGTGPMMVTLSHTIDSQQFTAVLDLTRCGVTAIEHFQKRVDDPFTVRLTGNTVPETAGVRGITVAYGGEQVTLRIEGERMIADTLDLNLEPLAGLLTQDVHPHGHVSGRVSTAPFACALNFAEVGASFGDSGAIESLTGGVAYSDKGISCKDMNFRAAESAGVLTLDWRPEQWQGNLKAASVNLDALQELLDAVLAYRKTAASPEPQPEAVTSTGTLHGEIDAFTFHQAQFGRVAGVVSMDERGTRIEALTMRPGAGLAEGSIRMPRPAPDATPFIEIDLALADVDLRVFDQLIFDASRGIHGKATGTIKLNLPIAGDENPMNQATGTVEINARNGSFGKLGMATKLLAVLKTVEILRLRVPAMRDKGLTYDTWAGAFSLQDGVMQVNEFALNSPPMTLAAAGVVDFPKDASNMKARVHLLGSMLGKADNVPTADRIKANTGMELAIQGSPYDPTVRIVSGRPLKKVRDAVKLGEDAVMDATHKALDRLLGK